MIVMGKLDSVLFLLREATESRVTGLGTRRTLRAARRLGLNENELGSVIKALELEYVTEWNDEKKEWQVKQGKK
jgi:hypothetical protein